MFLESSVRSLTKGLTDIGFGSALEFMDLPLALNPKILKPSTSCKPGPSMGVEGFGGYPIEANRSRTLNLNP